MVIKLLEGSMTFRKNFRVHIEIFEINFRMGDVSFEIKRYPRMKKITKIKNKMHKNTR